jgi:hypothetical protein
MNEIAPHEAYPRLRLLTVTQGAWGERAAANIDYSCPAHWTQYRYWASNPLPTMDDPANFLPASLPAVDLVLALGETPELAQLIPGIVQRTGARSVIVPIDDNASLPPAVMLQLSGWLADLGAAAVFPKPFCSLTQTSYSLPPIRVAYDNPFIREFARVFGQPVLAASLSSQGTVRLAAARDAACGCAHYAAQGLSNQPLTFATDEVVMLHHHFPCLASTDPDPDYGDSLRRVSSRILREAVKSELRPYLEPARELRPAVPAEIQASAAQ